MDKTPAVLDDEVVVINLTEDKGQVFRGALRVVKPGGRLEVSNEAGID